MHADWCLHASWYPWFHDAFFSPWCRGGGGEKQEGELSPQLPRRSPGSAGQGSYPGQGGYPGPGFGARPPPPFGHQHSGCSDHPLTCPNSDSFENRHVVFGVHAECRLLDSAAFKKPFALKVCATYVFTSWEKSGLLLYLVLCSKQSQEEIAQ